MAFDEMWVGNDQISPSYRAYQAWLKTVSPELLHRKHDEADELFRRLGITFAVYGDEGGTERLIPFDPIPRILAASEWKTLSEGCCQRVRALNAFLHDI